MEPLIVIIVPVYNTAKYLRECLNSIKNQTYNNYICFVIDDGSTDDSLDIANKYANDSGLKKFLIFSKQNGGVSSARNFALNIIDKQDINPDYICFVDSDDVIKPTFIESFIKNLIKNDADYAVCGYDEFDKTGIVLNKKRKTKPEILNNIQIIEHFYTVNNYGCGKGMPYKYSDTTNTWALYNKCFRYRCIKNIRFDPSLRNCADMKFFLEASSSLTKGIIIDEQLYMYRLRASSLAHNQSYEFETRLNNYNVLLEAVNNNSYHKIKQILSICLCRECYNCFYKAIECNRFDEAKKFFYELKNFMTLFSKEDVEKELYNKISRTKYGFILNKLYTKFKLYKKRSKSAVKKSNYFS